MKPHEINNAIDAMIDPKKNRLLNYHGDLNALREVERLTECDPLPTPEATPGASSVDNNKSTAGENENEH